MVGRARFGIASVVVLATAAVASAPGSASAQDEADLERARELFADGVEHADAERHAEAAAAFEAAYDLHPAPAIAYNLASVLEPLGRVVEARALLESVLRDESANDELRGWAETLKTTVDARIAHLSIRLDGDAADVTVDVDEREVTPDELFAPVAVDPGSHTVSARRGESVVDTQSVTVRDGGSTEVVLALGGELASGPSEDPWEQPWFWGVIAGSVALVAILTAVAVSSGPDDPVPGTAGVITWQ